MFGFGKGSRELNLIPEEEQKLRNKKIKVVTLVVVGLLVGLQLAIFFGITFLEQIEKNSRNSLERDLTKKTSEWQSIASPAAQIKTTKNKLATYNTFLTSHSDPNSKISKVQKAIPTGILLKNLSISNKNEIKVEGEASQPNVIYQFSNVLNEGKQDFNKVVLEAISKSDTGVYNFIINFNLK